MDIQKDHAHRGQLNNRKKNSIAHVQVRRSQQTEKSGTDTLPILRSDSDGPVY